MDITTTPIAQPATAPAAGAEPRPLRSLRAWVCALAALGATIFLFGVALYAAVHDKETAAAYGVRFFRLPLGGHDSWRPMLRALYELHGDPDIPLYSRVFFDLKVKFQYPTSSLFLPDIVQRLIGGDWLTVYAALNLLSWLVAWGIGIACWRLFLDAYRAAGCPRSESPRDKLLLLACCLGLTILFYPLTLSVSLGQIQTTMTLLLALALLLWPHDRKWPGLLIGLCCAIKPQWAILLVWGALRREWSMVATGTATVAGLSILSGFVYGFSNQLDYLAVLSYLSRLGESYYLNQSVNGLTNRLLFTGDNVDHNEFGQGFPDFNPAVYAATVGSSAIVLLAALAFRRRQRPGRLDLALAMLSVTIASPVAWVHHYGVLLPIFALAAPACLSDKPFGRWSGAYLLIAFVLASQRFAMTDLLAFEPWNVVQSHLLFAAFMVLILLYRMARSDSESGGSRHYREPA